jgi:serine/threonine-protein kinase
MFLALSLLAAGRQAKASDPAAAQVLFDEAKRLMSAGRYDEACPKLQESQKLDAGMGTQFHLADCWQHVGRTASAWALFREVESEAHALGNQGRERVARDRATALRPFLSKLVIVARDPHGGASTGDLDVRRDGVSVGRGQWGMAVPVDPGPHVVTMVAPNKRPWQTNVDVPPNGKTITISLPALADVPDAQLLPAPAPSPLPTPKAKPAPASSSTRDRGVTSEMPPPPRYEGTPEVESRGGAQRAFGWFFVGGGVVGIAVSAYFGAKWIDDRNAQVAHCPDNRCDPVGVNLRNDGHQQAMTAAVTISAGAASLVLGSVLVASAPGPRVVAKNGATVEVAPIAALTQAGLTVRGAW